MKETSSFPCSLKLCIGKEITKDSYTMHTDILYTMDTCGQPDVRDMENQIKKKKVLQESNGETTESREGKGRGMRSSWRGKFLSSSSQVLVL